MLGKLVCSLKFIGTAFFAEGEKIVFKIALPVLLFLEVASASPGELFDGDLVLFCILGISVLFVILCITVPLFIKDNRKRGAFIQGVYRTNFAILGIPIATNMCGEAAGEKIAVVMPFAIILFNVFAVTVLSIFAPDREKKSFGKTVSVILKNIFLNPLIIACIVAIPFAVFEIPLPTAAEKTLGYISALATPLSLMCLGASLSFTAMKGRGALFLTATVLKTVIVPVIFVGLAILLGFRGGSLAVTVVLFGGPSAASSYIMAKNMDSDYHLAGQIMLFTTVVSTFTIFLSVLLLNILQFI